MKVEIRGRGRKWQVWYPDESDIATELPVYDRDGNLKETLLVGCPTGKLVESLFTGTRDEATEHAYAIGATEVTYRPIKARAARKA